MACAFKDCEETQLPILVKERIGKLFAPYHIDFSRKVDVDRALALLHHFRPQEALKVIKTWLNGWATSAHMHEEVLLPCLLGCTYGEDSLNHYLQCPHVVAFCKFFFFFLIDSRPLICIAIKSPTINNLKATSCVFTAYHALKGQVVEGRIDMHENAGTQRVAWSVFANALEAEAGECHIPYVAFSLPKFISFLAEGHEHPCQDGTATDSNQT